MVLNIHLQVNDKVVKVCLNETDFAVSANDEDDDVVVAVEDIVAFEENTSDSDVSACIVHYIKRHPKSIWTKEIISLQKVENGDEDFQRFYRELQQKFDKTATVRPKRLLVLMNPVGGNRKARQIYDTVMMPVFELAKVTCDLVVSQRPKHLIEVMTDYDCKDVDGIVIMGGDGTFSEVINVLVKKTQEEAGVDYNDPNTELKPLSKPVSVVPTGTGNGVAEGLTYCQDALTTTLHIIRGKTKHINLLVNYCENKLVSCSGCIFGTLYAAELIDMVDRQFRWMRAARYLIVPFCFFLKAIRTVPVEITVYSREKQVDEKDVEKIVEKAETFTQDCCMFFIFPGAILDDDGKMCTDFKKISKDEFCGLVYEPMGKMALAMNINSFRKRDESACLHPKIRIVRGHALSWKVLGTDKPAESDRRNCITSIDGEVIDNTKAEFYIKLVKHVVTAYSSV